MQSFGIADDAAGIRRQLRAESRASASCSMTMLSLTTGTAFIMWLGEQITERGIGNGMSLIIFAGIVVGLPQRDQRDLYQRVRHPPVERLPVADHPADDDRGGGFHRAGRARRAAHSGAVRQARRRTPHDGRTVDAPAAEGQRRRRDPGDLRVSSLLAFPQTLAQCRVRPKQPYLTRTARSDQRHFEPLYFVLFTALIIFFCFFYVSIIFNPNEAADNMRKYGGFIPGIRPGKNTAEYMNKILTKITVVGGLYLAICR